jgi:hypothetical protein
MKIEMLPRRLPPFANLSAAPGAEIKKAAGRFA